MHRGPVAEIDLSALRHNLEILKQKAGKSEIIAVVKADAYGHGAVAVAGCLASEGVSNFAVAYSEEAKVLRESGIGGKIIVLFDHADIEDYFNYNLVPVIRDMAAARAFDSAAQKKGQRLPVHMKIDTGMGRIGFLPESAAGYALEIASCDGLRLEGLLSHFSETYPGDRTFATHQLKLFQGIRDDICARTGLSLICHIANSAAIFAMPGACFDAVRPGISLYGYSSLSESFGLKPVMHIKSKIIAIRSLHAGTPVSYGRTFITKRESRIAVVPVGYADGYNRLFSNNAEMLINGKKAPVVGRVCMDVTMADVTDLPDAAEGDKVVLLGVQGSGAVTASGLAARINTIPYEILTSMGSRSGKEYVN